MTPTCLAQLLDDASASLKTERLDLRPIRTQHAEPLYSVLAAPELYMFTGGGPSESVEALARRFAVWETRRAPDGSEIWLNWMVQQSESAEAVGYVQATLAEGRADLAWVIGVPWQGHGYASEAAMAMMSWLQGHGVARFRACVKPNHIASQRVASRLGLLRTDAWIDGEEVWVVERIGYT